MRVQVVVIDYRCADGRSWLSVRGVTILNSRSVTSSETGVRNGIKEKKKAGKHTYFHQVNGRKLLVVYSVISEGLQLYSQI